MMREKTKLINPAKVVCVELWKMSFSPTPLFPQLELAAVVPFVLRMGPDDLELLTINCFHGPRDMLGHVRGWGMVDMPRPPLNEWDLEPRPGMPWGPGNMYPGLIPHQGTEWMISLQQKNMIFVPPWQKSIVSKPALEWEKHMLVHRGGIFSVRVPGAMRGGWCEEYGKQWLMDIIRERGVISPRAPYGWGQHDFGTWQRFQEQALAEVPRPPQGVGPSPSVAAVPFVLQDPPASSEQVPWRQRQLRVGGRPMRNPFAALTYLLKAFRAEAESRSASAPPGSADAALRPVEGSGGRMASVDVRPSPMSPLPVVDPAPVLDAIDPIAPIAQGTPFMEEDWGGDAVVLGLASSDDAVPGSDPVKVEMDEIFDELMFEPIDSPDPYIPSTPSPAMMDVPAAAGSPVSPPPVPSSSSFPRTAEVDHAYRNLLRSLFQEQVVRFGAFQCPLPVVIRGSPDGQRLPGGARGEASLDED